MLETAHPDAVTAQLGKKLTGMAAPQETIETRSLKRLIAIGHQQCVEASGIGPSRLTCRPRPFPVP